jgi:hypothetical protein
VPNGAMVCKPETPVVRTAVLGGLTRTRRLNAILADKAIIGGHVSQQRKLSVVGLRYR